MSKKNGDVGVVILAAGQSTRFRSQIPKLLHPLAGRPMGQYVLDATRPLHPRRILVVIGHQADQVREAFAAPDIEFILQEKQLGTGHALRVAKPQLEKSTLSHLLVLVGDIPLLRTETLRAFLESHRRQHAAASILTFRVENPHGYGRLVHRGPLPLGVVEEKNCTPAQRKIQEVSSGILCFDCKKLLAHVETLTDQNPQGEYLLADLLPVFQRKRFKITAYRAPEPEELQGINDRVDLARVEKLLRRRKCESLMRSGVTLIDPETTYIESAVEVGPDTVVEPGVSLRGDTQVGSQCQIHAYSTLQDARIGDRVTIRPCSVIAASQVASDATVGPFAHLRDGTRIEPGARVGNFVEVKKSQVGSGSKALHLTYLGDATLGQRVNIGAGTVTCNYDGEKKWPTHIEEGCFIGSGSMLIAPLRVGKDAYVAAGSTITDDVPEGSLSIGRARRQVNKAGWAAQRAARKLKQAAVEPKATTPRPKQ